MSRGHLGRCHALELARRGAKVVVNDWRRDGRQWWFLEAAEAVVAEIKAMGGEAVANGGSVSDRAGAQHGRRSRECLVIDVLINNAGICAISRFQK